MASLLLYKSLVVEINHAPTCQSATLILSNLNDTLHYWQMVAVSDLKGHSMLKSRQLIYDIFMLFTWHLYTIALAFKYWF